MAMTPKQALSNLMAAITGNDVLKSGLFVGTYKQHTVLQESVDTLAEAIGLTNANGSIKGTDDEPPTERE